MPKEGKNIYCPNCGCMTLGKHCKWCGPPELYETDPKYCEDCGGIKEKEAEENARLK